MRGKRGFEKGFSERRESVFDENSVTVTTGVTFQVISYESEVEQCQLKKGQDLCLNKYMDSTVVWEYRRKDVMSDEYESQKKNKEKQKG